MAQRDPQLHNKVARATLLRQSKGCVSIMEQETLSRSMTVRPVAEEYEKAATPNLWEADPLLLAMRARLQVLQVSRLGKLLSTQERTHRLDYQAKSRLENASGHSSPKPRSKNKENHHRMDQRANMFS